MKAKFLIQKLRNSWINFDNRLCKTTNSKPDMFTRVASYMDQVKKEYFLIHIFHLSLITPLNMDEPWQIAK